MNDQEQTVTWLSRASDDLPGRFLVDDSAIPDDRTADATAGLVSLGFLGAALRRSARLWCTLGVVGLLIGCAWAVTFPAAQKATVSVLLADNPNQNPGDEIVTDMALARSNPVAEAVIKQEGLRQTPAAFLGTYTVAMVTDRILAITVGAPTSQEAVQWASSVATQYLKFRALYGQIQQQQTDAQLNQQVSQAEQQLQSITSKISQLESASRSSTQQAELSNLKAQQVTASNTLSQVQQYAVSTIASTQTATQQLVQGSQVLDAAAPLAHSRLKTLVLYALGGLIGGAGLGMAIVIIAAITSDRLRRRDDIAYAFGAPVRLSVGPLSVGRLSVGRLSVGRLSVGRLSLGRLSDSRWSPAAGGGAARQRDMERLVEHLRSVVTGGPKPSYLAVVAVDNAPTVAQAVLALAVSVSDATQPFRVVLADLSAGAHAARLLGIDKPGMSTVSPEGVPIGVVVPASGEVAPAGPLLPEGNGHIDEQLAALCASADLMLSLVTLDPAFGGEHLAGWATDVVAVITAGQSTAVRIHAVGEMIRLSGTRVSSVVVIGADKLDESLGASSTGYQPVSH